MKQNNSGANNSTQTKFLSPEEPKVKERERAMFITRQQIEEILLRNVRRNVSLTFTQYTKEMIRQFLLSPAANQDALRNVSRFLERNSMIYRKLLMYYAAMPLFHYNITQINDLNKEIDPKKSLKKYLQTVEEFAKFDIKQHGYTALYIAIRDGYYVAYHYHTKDSIFPMILDQQYCRIRGKDKDDQWVVWFNAAYFDAGNNKEFVLGIDEDDNGVWDQVFIDGYNQFKEFGRDYQWFPLPTEKTCVLLACPEDEFQYPLPWFVGLFTDLLDLLDLQQILQSKAELENYKMIINKIPFMKDSDSVDDFAVSKEFTQVFNQLMEQSAPEQVGVTYSPFDVEVIDFEKSNNATDTDRLGKSFQNLFNNAGATQLVVAGGGNTSTLAIKYSQLNDQSNIWIVVNRYQHWLNHFIKYEINEGHPMEILPITWYNREDYVQEKKDIATLGGPALDLLIASDGTPYKALQKLRFEDALGIKDMMVPLKSSYNTGSDDREVGRPATPDDELEDSSERTRNS